MAQNNMDLAKIFQEVTESLAENQQALNQADDYNKNHGDNMVQTFQTITNALEQKKGTTNKTALKYAAKQVSKQANSGSSSLYAQNLLKAANQVQGKKMDPQDTLQLLQTLIGGQAGSTNAGDLLGSLMGSLSGETVQQAQTAQPAAQMSGGDLLGSLLGGLQGGGSSSNQDGFGLDDLLSAGMGFMQARQSGASGFQALAQAVLGSSGMGNSSHRTQSTQIVVDSFLQALGGMNR